MRLEGRGWAGSCWLVSVSVLSKYWCPTSTWWSFSSWSSLASCFFEDVFFRWSNTEAVCCGECFKFWLRRVFLDQSVHRGRLSSIWEVKPLRGKCSIFSPDGFPELNVVYNPFPCFYSLTYFEMSSGSLRGSIHISSLKLRFRCRCVQGYPPAAFSLSTFAHICWISDWESKNESGN